MKKIILSILLLLHSNLTYCSEYSVYAAKNFAYKRCVDKVKITVKKEHLQLFAQEIDGKFIPYIVYGYGDLKSKQTRKIRISYICLLNFSQKPIWSDIYISK